MAADRTRMLPSVRDLAEHVELVQSVMIVSLGLVLAAPLWRALVSDAGLFAALIALTGIAGYSAAVRRDRIDWMNALPLSILLLCGWTLASLIWSYQPLESLWRITVLLLTTGLGLSIAWTRDSIQIVRGVGDVLRVLFVLSIGLEVVLSLMGATWPAAHIDGTLLQGGPITGVFGSRAATATMAIVGLVTFGIEWRTRSVRPGTGIASLLLAGVLLTLAISPITLVALIVVVAATGAIWILRRSSPRVRWRWNTAFIAAVVCGTFGVWLLRVPIIELLDGRGETSSRVAVWQELSRYLLYRPLTGWGYSGDWWDGAPYTWVREATERTLDGAVNGYVDVYFQLGLIGLLLFVAVLGTGLVRAWMMASNRRSVVYVWPAVVLVVLAVASTADGFVLTGAGWLLLVIAATKSAREFTWGDAWRTRLGSALPSRSGR